MPCTIGEPLASYDPTFAQQSLTKFLGALNRRGSGLAQQRSSATAHAVSPHPALQQCTLLGIKQG
ncbi:hypothetical protein AQ808_13035 [Burkholderia pseudomallei]|nr:hypothetical protein ADU20_07850 [Burkholderia pseudomallei]OMW33358.1 hypothetical protein AQ808_13035 [Burkholderia pseudomallei]